MTKYFCDRCCRETPTRYFVSMDVARLTTPLTGRTGSLSYELCAECIALVQAVCTGRKAVDVQNTSITP